MEIKAFLEISTKIPIKTSRDKTFFLGLKNPCFDWFLGYIIVKDPIILMALVSVQSSLGHVSIILKRKKLIAKYLK